MYPLTKEQKQFLSWLNRNYEWLVSRGFKSETQPFQHNIHRIMVDGTYSDTDKNTILKAIKFIRGMGLVSYHKGWTWDGDKDVNNLDWLVNVKVDTNFRCGESFTKLWGQHL
jgi:hypothetical protein